MTRKADKQVRERFNHPGLAESIKERQPRRTQAQKSFPERSGSAPDFFGFADWRIEGVHFFACVQDLLDEALSLQWRASCWGVTG